MAAASSASVAWLSVTVKRGATVVVPSKIMKCNWEDTFGELLEKAAPQLHTSTLKVKISKKEQFVTSQEVSIDAPVSVCNQFDCKYICYMLLESTDGTGVAVRPSVGGTTRPLNAFEVLMSSSSRIVLPPCISSGETIRGDHAIYNKFLHILEDNSLGWSPDVVKGTGDKFVKAVSDALWVLDPHHKQFSDRACTLPSIFSQFQGFNDWQRKKQKKPQLSQGILEKHVGVLSNYLMQPWLGNQKWKGFRPNIEGLVEAMNKYKSYLVSHSESMSRAHKSMSPPVLPSEVFSVTPISASSQPTESKYLVVEKALDDLELYQPIFLNEFAPEDRYSRRHWMDNICFRFPCMLYKCPHRANIGTMCFAWKVPESIDSTHNSRVIAQISAAESLYATRAMRKDFLDKYYRLVKTPKSVLRNIYTTLIGDCSSASCAAQQEVDDRVAKALLELDDPDIMLDMRELNGNPKSTKFDIFWGEVHQYLEECTMAVDERRHTDVMHLPLAISVRHLIDTIVKRLEAKSSSLPPIPSLEWVRLQFWPANPYSNAALRYTGRFAVKYAVQVRQLRKEHVDARYVGNILKYAKEFAVQLSSLICMVSVDDKAIVPVGEPNAPVSTGVRGHHKSLASTSGPHNCALDHDFHIHGIVPSVAFVVNIPSSSKDSFFQGVPHVVVKDKVTQPSSALRHSTELKSIVKEGGLPKPILMVVSDGGPDHRITFPSVKLALVALFRALDLDMLVSIRTCPYQSWTNLAERVMSTLNLALQNTALARRQMEESFEASIKSKNSLKEVRKVMKDHPGLCEALRDSMSYPTKLLCDRFRMMKLKDEPVVVGFPATEDEIKDMLEHLRFIEPNIESEGDLTSDTISKSEPLQKFFDTHTSATHYVFQVKKCLNPECFYCSQHPIHMSIAQFQSLSYLPLPILDETKESFLPFDKVYGQLPSERHQPSKGSPEQQEAKEIDKQRKSLFVNGKVRQVINCNECLKPRCVFSSKKLSKAEKVVLEDIDYSKLYTCGSPLFPSSSCHSDSIVVRQSLTCADPIEVQYYSSTLISFPNVCFYCGTSEESLVEDENILELRKQFAVVRPICFLCRSSGKRPATRQANNMAKKPRKS